MDFFQFKELNSFWFIQNYDVQTSCGDAMALSLIAIIITSYASDRFDGIFGRKLCASNTDVSWIVNSQILALFRFVHLLNSQSEKNVSRSGGFHISYSQLYHCFAVAPSFHTNNSNINEFSINVNETMKNGKTSCTANHLNAQTVHFICEFAILLGRQASKLDDTSLQFTLAALITFNGGARFALCNA